MNSSYTSTSFEASPRRTVTSGITARFEYANTSSQPEPLYQNDSYSYKHTRTNPTPPPVPIKSQPSPIYAQPHRRSHSPVSAPISLPSPPVVRHPAPKFNCAELDTLLDDLNARPQPIQPKKVVQSTHYTTVRSSRLENDRVNHLITNLERNLAEPTDTRKYKGEEVRPITVTEFYETKESKNQFVQPSVSSRGGRTSNATNELDDLMASLHDLKIPVQKTVTTQQQQQSRNNQANQEGGIQYSQGVQTKYQTTITKSAKMNEETADYAVCKPRDQRNGRDQVDRSEKQIRTESNHLNNHHQQHDHSHKHQHHHHQQQQQQQHHHHHQSSHSYDSQSNDSNQLLQKVQTHTTKQMANTSQRATTTSGPLESIMGSIEIELSREGVDVGSKGRCYTCDKVIAGQVLSALGRTYHPQHFTCAHCDCTLGERPFFERDGKVYCEPDYERLFAPRCAFCQQAIISGQQCVTALDQHYHAEHFFCADCGVTFDQERGYHSHEQRPYCSDCYLARFAAKCVDCGKPITSSFISALGGQWHVQCFVCAECRCEFAAGAFFELDGRPYCETHFHARKGTLCAGCHQPITGRCVTAMYRKFHPEHFVCCFCLKQLNKGTFKEHNDKPYCHGCFDKLFG